MTTVDALVAVFAAAGVATWLAALILPRAFPGMLLDEPGGRKTHPVATTRWGGTALLVGLGLLFAWAADLGLGERLGRPFAAAAVAIAAAWAIGFVDDARPMGPWRKLGWQAAAAGVVAVSGLTVNAFGTPLADVPLTIGFVLLVLNGYNLLDGLNGLLGLHATVVALALLRISWAPGAEASLTPFLAGGLVVVLAGFLPANVVRGRVFLGDSGSLLIGMVVAVALLDGPVRSGTPGWRATWLLVALPVFDLVWAFWRRVLRGEHPFQPDRGHVHHVLARLIGPELAVAAIALATMVLAFAAVAVG